MPTRAKTVPIPERLVWKVDDLAAMVDVSATFVYDRMNPDRTVCELYPGVELPVTHDHNGHCVFRAAQVRRLLDGV